MGVWWCWGWEMRQLHLPAQHLKRGTVTAALLTHLPCVPPPAPALLWEGAGIYPGQTLSFSPSAGHLAWGSGTAGSPWTFCPAGLRAVEGRWSRGEDLGTSSSLAWTAAGIQAGHKEQEIDLEQRFTSGT